MRAHGSCIDSVNEAGSPRPRSSVEDMAGETSFVCERVCTSDRLLRRLGKLAKVRTSSHARVRRHSAPRHANGLLQHSGPRSPGDARIPISHAAVAFQQAGPPQARRRLGRDAAPLQRFARHGAREHLSRQTCKMHSVAPATSPTPAPAPACKQQDQTRLHPVAPGPHAQLLHHRLRRFRWALWREGLFRTLQSLERACRLPSALRTARCAAIPPACSCSALLPSPSPPPHALAPPTSFPSPSPAANDACVEACQRSVCSIPHQVPAWNEACLKRCTAECLKGRAG